MKSRVLASVLLGSCFLALGCAAGNCRQTGMASEPGAGGSTTSNGTVAAPQVNPPAATTSQTALVYKYDGSQQCGMGKAVSAEEMEKELKGIPVLSKEKRADGLMRIQVCGAMTGMANLYKIPATHLADAEKRGFKAWTF